MIELLTARRPPHSLLGLSSRQGRVCYSHVCDVFVYEMGQGKTATRREYCPRCDAEREVLKTAPWQLDMCLECGNEIGD